MWIPPINYGLKFNMDGPTKGKPSQTGIGGVLRYANSKVLCMFSLSVGLQDPNTAEVPVLAIQQECSLCMSKSWLVGDEIEIVSDSKLAVTWINGVGRPQYDWNEISPSMQMLGRAGRPQYDSHGEGIVITYHWP
ncbi:hypothetical protein Ddye_014325 [Dipteronia dyeriana]|uniref:RNase H type-1 domain-containing protein n=1 Tax=Dipteronia dyeriana TaxID=168575 RepID=A0AAD9X7W7_9ROSI|nr:hypothetical protein Ddye_014325 [Dipteronia dyeriana]